MRLISFILPSLKIESVQIWSNKSVFKTTIVLNQTRTYYIVREGRKFEINPVDPFTQLDGVTII